jgi:hypothetical protein
MPEGLCPKSALYFPSFSLALVKAAERSVNTATIARSVDGKTGKRRLNLYRELIALRRQEPCLLQGEYRPRRAQNDVFSFVRGLNGTEILIGLNISGEPRLWEWQGSGVRLLSTGPDRASGKVEDQYTSSRTKASSSK